MIEHTIPEAVRPLPLEKYLRRAWPMAPGHVLRDALKKRDVRVNGAKAEGGAKVAGGDRLALYVDGRFFDMAPEVLWTDERLIVAIKPQGLPVDADQDGIGADTLLLRLRTRWPGARLCHRLDAATGGIVLAANDDRVWDQAFEAFKCHGVRKRYHAVALGDFDRREGTLRAWLRKDAASATVHVLHREAPGAKPIETRFRVGEPAGDGAWHVALEPVTGRTHQLRAHMADYGHPLLGDDKYGDREANRRHPGRLRLWHERLTIPEDSPLADYRGRTFEAPAPEW